MKIRPIRYEEEYEKRLEQMESFFENEPEPGTADGDQFDPLTMVTSDYED